ncbi:hypothetical protein B0H15DRAFT_958756 [Mycena belliarum]|uniref:Uncharacterized protein n=1 Tax=Mycena belliarum TaxID=1033014 RepID=A0AAD6XH95_9AGAR|nr:hypothetical protein B0H15DRAFT_958756 [Mycena belliae]
MSTKFTTIAGASHQHVRFTEPKPRAKLTADQEKEKRQEREKRQDEIDEILAKWYTDTMALADDLAVRFKMKPKYFHELMFQGGARMLTHQTKVNPYNAFKAEKAAECRDRGEAKNVADLHNEYFEEYSQLTDEQKADIVERHQDLRTREVKLRRETPRGKIQDVANTARNMELLMVGLGRRVGIEGFFCIVRNSSDFHMKPRWYFTSKALQEYMPLATRAKWTTTGVGAKVEAFAVAGCDVVNLLRNSKQKADHLKMTIRDLMTEKFSAITKKPNSKFPYVNYEEDCVHKYGYRLVGWTYGELVNPSEMSTSLPALEKLRDALRDDECHFEKLSTEALATRIAEYKADVAAGRALGKFRETRKDAGTKRPRTTDTNDDDEPDANGTDTASAPPPPKKRRVRKTTAVPPPTGDEDEEDRPPQEVLPPKRKGTKTAPKAASKAPAKKTLARKAPRDDEVTRAALLRIKSRAIITSDDEREDDPEANMEEGSAPSGGGSGGDMPADAMAQSRAEVSAPSSGSPGGDMPAASTATSAHAPPRAFITSDDEMEDDPEADMEEGSAPSGGGAGRDMAAGAMEMASGAVASS